MFDESSFDKKERAETRPPTDLVCLPLDDSEFNRHWSQDESFKFDKIYKICKCKWQSQVGCRFFSAEFYIYKLFKIQVSS